MNKGTERNHKTSASVKEGFKGRNLEEKEEFFEVLEIYCIFFIPSNEKQYCIFTYCFSALKDTVWSSRMTM